MAILVVLIVAAAVLLAALCLGNAVAVLLGRSRARRDADAAITRLNSRYQDAMREMRRRRYPLSESLPEPSFSTTPPEKGNASCPTSHRPN